MEKQEKIAVIRPFAAQLGLKSSQLNQMTPEQLDEQYAKAQALAVETATADAPTGQNAPVANATGSAIPVTTLLAPNAVHIVKETGEAVPAFKGTILFAPNATSGDLMKVSVDGTIVHVNMNLGLRKLQDSEDALQAGMEILLRASEKDLRVSSRGKFYGAILVESYEPLNVITKQFYNDNKAEEDFAVSAIMSEAKLSAAAARELVQARKNQKAQSILDKLGL